MTDIEKDATGFAPAGRQECDNGKDCAGCNGLGWILCDHEGAEIEADPFNEEGHYEWCNRCNAPADDSKTWAWCPQRSN